MGFSIQNVVILYWLKHHGLLKAGDAVLELGSQQINNDVIEHLEQVDVLARIFGVESFSSKFSWSVTERKTLDGGMPHLPKNAPYAKELYEHLGLHYHSIDIAASPCSIRLDLNFDGVPVEHAGCYALVTNLGTTEHVMNQLNAFRVIHDLTAKDGVMIHSLPFQGFATHGLVNYTMKFFWLLAQSNGYRVIDADVSAWERAPIPKKVLDFVKTHAEVFADKKRAEVLETQDTGITMILQKRHSRGFVPPLDVPDGPQNDDFMLGGRYWPLLQTGGSRMSLLKVLNSLKRFFNK